MGIAIAVAKSKRQSAPCSRRVRAHAGLLCCRSICPSGRKGWPRGRQALGPASSQAELGLDPRFKFRNRRGVRKPPGPRESPGRASLRGSREALVALEHLDRGELRRKDVRDALLHVGLVGLASRRDAASFVEHRERTEPAELAIHGA